jgi:pseudaminic acid biosynthesis-associated methylase
MGQNPREMWAGGFGERYTDRASSTVEEANENSLEKYGISLLDRYEQFFRHISRDATVLEVGANMGTKLAALKEMGFEKLYGIDVQRKAIEKAHEKRPELNIIKGDAINIPFKDGFFDLVFTSGVLITIPPKNIDLVMNEIVRCSSEWVYGCEYYSEEYAEINYRGNENMLWKTDFPSLFHENYSLELVDMEYREDSTYSKDTVDVEYLLRKSG